MSWWKRAGLMLAALNCRWLSGYVRNARTAGRRAAASALALVSGAMALEALTFLAAPAVEVSPALRDASEVLVRGALLMASASISVLLLRAGRSKA